jgi:hypothetical protein
MDFLFTFRKSKSKEIFLTHGQLHYHSRHLFNIDVVFQSIFCSSRKRIVPTFHILS